MAISLIAIAWGVGGALLSGGGVGITLSALRKKDKAEFQRVVDELNRRLLESQNREKELLQSIEKLESEKRDIIERMKSLEIQLVKKNDEIEKIASNIKSNDARFKKIIAVLTFRWNKLQKENEQLKKLLEAAQGGKKEIIARIESDDIRRLMIENDILSAIDNLKIEQVGQEACKLELKNAYAEEK